MKDIFNNVLAKRTAITLQHHAKKMGTSQHIALGLASTMLWSFAMAPSAFGMKQEAKQRKIDQRFAKIQASIKAAQVPKPLHLTLPKNTLKPQTDRHVVPVSSQASTPTLLDEVGHLTRVVPQTEVNGWKNELKTNHPNAARVALLHLWLGEWELASHEEPLTAIWHFSQIQRVTKPTDPMYGLASYDIATAHFYQGAFRVATRDFQRLLTPKSHQFYTSRHAAYWLRHASACAGYHAERAKLGIPEPPQLDPLCGAAALATCLKALDAPYDQKTLLSSCRVTGEGSNLQDVIDAAKKLGMNSQAISADDSGLKALPMPLVAYVEHDHFVAVVKADAKGVSYLCSDCGAWPGGQVNLTWKQWHKMEANIYAYVTRPGSQNDLLLSALDAQNDTTAKGVRVSYNGALSGLHITNRALLGPNLAGLRGHVFRQHQPTQAKCGFGRTSDPCPCPTCCPKDAPGNPPGGSPPGNHPPMRSHGASEGDPVNLATGEEEYTPSADLNVYNPHGPAVSWGRIYNSMREAGDGYPYGNSAYECNDFGVGWSHPYNVGVQDPTNGGVGTSNTKYVYSANGARLSFTAPYAPTVSIPSVTCTVQPGSPFLVEWNYDAGSSTGHYTVTWKDRTKWVTNTVGATSCYSLSKEIDRNGHAITFHYSAAPTGYNWDLLSSITNEDGTTLLKIQRAGDDTGNIVMVSDCYGRAVYYHCAFYSNTGVDPLFCQGYQELDHVSQIVPTCTANPPDRYVYGYQNVANGDGAETAVFLHTISIPSPTGTGTSTATINYDPTTDFVSSIVDANGNRRCYASVDINGNPSFPSSNTKVTIRDASNNVVYSYRVGYDMQMSQTSETNGNGVAISSHTFADPNNPYRPSVSIDGNGNTSHYTWDQYGNILSGTSPRGLVTTNTMDYSNFALGEIASTQEGSKTPTVYTYYEPSGLLQTENRPLPGTVGASLPTTPAYYYQYNTFGNVTSVTVPGNNAASTVTTTYNYTSDPGDSGHGISAYSQSASINQPLTETDNLGHVTHLRYDSQGNKTAEIDALGNETDCQYTIANNMYNVVYPATGQTGTGHASDYSVFLYPGGPILTDSKLDESGNQVRQEVLTYGPEGELLSQTGNGQSAYTTYDAAYRQATFSDGKSQTTTYAYNTTGYLASETYANGQQIQYTLYDLNGNLKTCIDPRGVETDYVYTDPESFISDIQYPATPSINVHFTYDSYGRKSAVTDGVGAYTYSYDDLNKQTAVTTTYTSLPARMIGYSYWPDGSLKGMAITDASSNPITGIPGAFSYGYDAAQRLATLTNPFGEQSSWAFLNNNWLSSRNAGGVVTATYTHNQRSFVTDCTNSTSTGTISEFGSILYDSVGNMLSVTSSLPSMTSYQGTTTYQHNSKNELTQEAGTGVGGYTDNYAYDAAGNPTTFRNSTVGSANNVNQLPGNTYDNAGNPATYNSNALSFDAEDRLSNVGSIVTNAYRGDSLRAWKQTSAGRIYFLYSGSDLVCEMDGSGNATAVNTFRGGGLISRHTASSGSMFYTFDTHGNVAQRVSSAGTVQSTQVFDAYGLRQSTSGSLDPYCGYGGQYGYYTDWETGTTASALELLSLRFYDPSAGRFLTRDPIGINGGANLYEYVSNGPTGKSDPSGEAPITIADYLAAWAICHTLMLDLEDIPAEDCDAAYRRCLDMALCASATGGIAVGLAAEAAAASQPELEFFAPYIGGCMEGIAQAIGNFYAEWACHFLLPCADQNPFEPWCALIQGLVGSVLSCIGGGIIGEEPPAIRRAITIVIMDLLSHIVGVSCDHTSIGNEPPGLRPGG